MWPTLAVAAWFRLAAGFLATTVLGWLCMVWVVVLLYLGSVQWRGAAVSCTFCVAVVAGGGVWMAAADAAHFRCAVASLAALLLDVGISLALLVWVTGASYPGCCSAPGAVGEGDVALGAWGTGQGGE